MTSSHDAEQLPPKNWTTHFFVSEAVYASCRATAGLGREETTAEFSPKIELCWRGGKPLSSPARTHGPSTPSAGA